MPLNARVVSQPRVEINLNAVSDDGSIRVWIADLPAGSVEGANLAVSDPDDDMQGIATLERLNEESGLAYLRVDWDSVSSIDETSDLMLTSPWVAAVVGLISRHDEHSNAWTVPPRPPLGPTWHYGLVARAMTPEEINEHGLEAATL